MPGVCLGVEERETIALGITREKRFSGITRKLKGPPPSSPVKSTVVVAEWVMLAPRPRRSPSAVPIQTLACAAEATLTNKEVVSKRVPGNAGRWLPQ